MTERLTIDRIGRRGDGVVDTPQGAIYVPFTLPGESVDTIAWPGHPDRRLPLAITTRSADRIAAICPHFATCGGCAMQHWQETRYHVWKRNLVVEALSQVDLRPPIDSLRDAHGVGRRRAVLHARRSPHDVLSVGFAAPRAHEIVAIDRCPVLAPALEGALPAAWAIADTIAPLRKSLDIQVTATDDGLDVDMRGSGPLDAAAHGNLARVAARHRLARLTRHGEIVAQVVVPTLQMGRARVALPPGAFLQATAAGEAMLAELVLDHCQASRLVCDLFAGVGPFTLRLAERARVLAIDNDAKALAALKQAADATRGLKPVHTEARDLFRRPLLGAELKRTDAVIFDPPRQGAEAQARAIAASAVPLVVAVSCNPATFARDVRILVDGGYRLIRVTPIDQFRYSPHVELVARLER